MADRADEIAREIAMDLVSKLGERSDPVWLERRVAAALRSYRNEAIEDAALMFEDYWQPAEAMVVRSLKSPNPESKP